MITDGDANLRDPPQFGFAFQFSAEVFSVRVDYVVRFLFSFFSFKAIVMSELFNFFSFGWCRLLGRIANRNDGNYFIIIWYF